MPLPQNKYHVNASEYSAAWFVKLYLDAVSVCSVCHVITTSTICRHNVLCLVHSSVKVTSSAWSKIVHLFSFAHVTNVTLVDIPLN